MRLDRGLIEETTGDRVGVRREVERRVDLALGVGVERDHVAVEQQPPDALEGLLRRAAIGHVLEEPQHAAEPVRPRVVEIVDPPPEQVRGAVEPPMLDAARM